MKTLSQITLLHGTRAALKRSQKFFRHFLQKDILRNPKIRLILDECRPPPTQRSNIVLSLQSHSSVALLCASAPLCQHDDSSIRAPRFQRGKLTAISSDHLESLTIFHAYNFPPTIASCIDINRVLNIPPNFAHAHLFWSASIFVFVPLPRLLGR